MKKSIFILLSAVSLFVSSLTQAAVVDGFVDVATVDPSIAVEMRYFSKWNFIGKVIDGYKANKCFLTKQAAKALSKVQTNLRANGYSLLVIDCYRPARAVTEFMQWAQDPKSLRMKKIFYPDEPKETLFSRGYISSRSGHSRGSTVDLTLVKIDSLGSLKSNPTVGRSWGGSLLRFQETPADCRTTDLKNSAQVDMGTFVDCLSTVASTDSTAVSAEARRNRMTLKNAMEKFGFSHYSKEWWHFTLRDEPFKDRYFDFVIE